MSIDGRQPVISVVVPTRNRSRRVEQLLAALNDQDVSEPFEVILVDDASADDEAAELERILSRACVQVSLLKLPRRCGPAAARNAGWRESRAPFVAFTDDDCKPEKGWLGALLAALRTSDYVQGRTAPDPDERDSLGPFDRTIEVGGENGFYETSNMAYRRDLLERLDGFDEGFRQAAGEDADLGRRARARGVRFRFAGDAVVHHAIVRPGFIGYVRNTVRWSGVVRAARLHPEMKRYFRRGPLWLTSHYLAALAAVGLVSAGVLAATRSTWAVAGLMLALPYVWHRPRIHTHHQGRARRSFSLAGVFVGDVAEIAVHALSLLRYRRSRLADRRGPARPDVTVADPGLSR